MKRNYFIAGVVTVSLLAGAGAALAHDRQGGMRGMGPMMFDFEAADADGDGKVSQAEMAAHAKARFDAADSDGNGKLSAAEMAATAQKRQEERRARMMQKMIERMDADDDGELSFDEMPGQQTRAEQMFSRIDSDGDGAVSKAEMEAARAKGGDQRGKGRHDRHRMHDMHGDHGMQGMRRSE